MLDFLYFMCVVNQRFILCLSICVIRYMRLQFVFNYRTSGIGSLFVNFGRLGIEQPSSLAHNVMRVTYSKFNRILHIFAEG